MTYMTFEESQKRAVYVVQCRTWQIAAGLDLCGVGVRCLPGQRDEVSQAIRNTLALAVRIERAKQRINKVN